MSRSVSFIPPESANVRALDGRRIAVLGFGSQGSAHALNLRDSRCNVVVAQRPSSPGYDEAFREGFSPLTTQDAALSADLLICALPDDRTPQIFENEIRPHLRPGQTLGFLHGFVIHYQQIQPPDDVDVILVAPKGQGRGVRQEFLAGRGVPALIAIHQDATGQARQTALGWAAGIGSHKAAILETTFEDETETDLFGEQAVLCGGLTALIKAGFETLVDAGYPPELAYFECCHEIKLLADLIHDHGITGMRERISSTARFGDLTRGPRVITDQTRNAMRDLLAEIQSGQFARELGSADQTATAARALEADRDHLVEQIGRKLRETMRPEDPGE